MAKGFCLGWGGACNFAESCGCAGTDCVPCWGCGAGCACTTCCCCRGGCGGGFTALGGPGRSASMSLRSVSLSGTGVRDCATRFWSEIMLVLGGFTVTGAGGKGTNVASSLGWIGTSTGPFGTHL